MVDKEKEDIWDWGFSELKKKICAELIEDRVFIWDPEDAKKIFEGFGFFGKIHENKLELTFEEAAFLLEQGVIELKEGKKSLRFNEFFEEASKKMYNFKSKYTVYKNLRLRGYPVKSGLKFGAHYRVYEKGANPNKRGVKKRREHTKWNVHAVSESDLFTPPEFSRAGRVSHSIRGRMLWAVADKQNNVHFFESIWITP